MRTPLHMYGIIVGMMIVTCVATPRDSTALVGIEGTFEYAFDAPWRMEPHDPGTGQFEYGAIPIQLSIHDAMHAALDADLEIEAVCSPDDQSSACEPCNGLGAGGCPQSKVCVVRSGHHSCIAATLINNPPKEWLGLGNVCQVTVRSDGFPTPYGFEDLAEIEMTKGTWSWPSSGSPPEHALCRAWKGDNCAPFQDISQTSEWHALLWYEPPSAPASGSDILLDIEVQVTRRPWIACNGLPSGDYPPLGEHSMLTLRNHVRVYFGGQPLPRFSNSWLYGDLHYHSQGTDNEGESAYNYRGVIRAMGAMGLDFLFATDHASNSEQIINADTEIADYDFPIDFDRLDTDLTGDVLRDMDRKRFAFNHGLIYGKNGVNAEAALNASQGRLPQGYLSHRIVPQIFLGGEVDVIPEVATANAYSRILYGNGLLFNVANLCGGWNRLLATWFEDCDPNDLWEAADDGYLLRDMQGINELHYGREHLVYLPRNAALELPVEPSPGGDEPLCEQCRIIPVNGKPTKVCYPRPCSECEGPCPPFESPLPAVDTAFIPSYTGPFGGARRRLTEPHEGIAPLLPELEKKGYAFVAHHLNAASDGSKEGPGAPPWSLHMLEKVWDSPAVLGLEFWNENGRLRSNIEDGEDGNEKGYEREVSWKNRPVNTIREGFLSGLFELVPYKDGEWARRSFDVEHNLHHGAFTWDMMNHWGLDLNRTRQLGWLAPGEPRRVFIAGGSDAHGDLNYRREGYFLNTTSTNDTAIGNPRNLVLVGRPPKHQINPDLPVNPDVTPAGDPGEIGNFEVSLEAVNSGDGIVDAFPHTQGQIIEALHEGRFSVTDGPALRIAIDQNGNNKIDAGDVQMGGLVQLKRPLPLSGTAPLRVLVEWLSTPEFGPVTKIDLYVGAHASQLDPDGSGRTYAPQSHGTRDCRRAPPSSSQYSYNSGGRTYTKMQDGYWLDQTLRLIPPASASYAGTAPFILDLNRFEFKEGSPGSRFFIRAFAQTIHSGLSECPPADGVRPTDPIPRYAFTNPIWVLKHNPLTPVDTIDLTP